MNERTDANERRGFTLIELLVVIAIIAVLAGLILATAGHATSVARRSRVEAERETLVTALQSYKASKGFYPPDNQLSQPVPYINPLFYELTGATNTQSGNPPAPDRFFSMVNKDVLTVANIYAVFGGQSPTTAGFANASTDPSQVGNYIPSTAKSIRTGTFVTNGVTITLFGVPIPGPIQLPIVGGGSLNPWCYVSTNPTNNGTSYDLWMDVYYSGKTNRVNNWSQNPQLL